jgi:uncharacterized protein (TIGR00255 family)
MTGYGAGQSTHEGVLVKVELRAVNHRFLDTSIRTPREFPGFENRVKEALKERLGRGRVSVTVDAGRESDAVRLVVDEPLAAGYAEVLRQLGERHGLPLAVDALSLAQLPDLVRREAAELDPGAAEAALDAALAAAIGQLEEMRAAEGRALQEDLTARVAHVDELLDRIEQAGQGAAEQVRERLRTRLARLLPDGLPVDEDRVAQEVALLADRADIVEELVRFRAHNRAFRAFLEKEEPVGKRLDFLLQEMNREVNTIGSKSQDAGLAHLVVEVKEEIERLREQVQNIE